MPWTYRQFAGFAALSLVCYTCVAGGVYYVYEMPDGTRMVTDHKVRQQVRLVRASYDVEGLGDLAAGRNDYDFNPAAGPDAYDKIIAAAAKKYGVDFALIKAVIHAESAFDPLALSKKGARGLMQLMPKTAAHYGLSRDQIYHPGRNIHTGAKYLKYLITKFKKRYLAIAAYNAGEGAVRRYKGIPPYKETRTYVRRVLYYSKIYSG